jgi:transposase-like protein
MLVELSVVEQRYQAVLAVIREGVPIVEVARRFDVSRQAVHRWLRWYEAQDLPGLVNRSHRPPRCSHQMAPAIEVWVLEARRRNPDWGPRRLVHEATRAGLDPVPSRSGVYRALRRAGLIERGARRRRDRRFRRWERGGPMELWQMDVVGGVVLADGRECKILTGIDDHSRFVVCSGLMLRATSRAVCTHFAEAMRRHGVPPRSSPTFKLGCALQVLGSSGRRPEDRRDRHPPTAVATPTGAEATPCQLTAGWAGLPPGRRIVLLGTR